MELTYLSFIRTKKCSCSFFIKNFKKKIKVNWSWGYKLWFLWTDDFWRGFWSKLCWRGEFFNVKMEIWLIFIRERQEEKFFRVKTILITWKFWEISINFDLIYQKKLEFHVKVALFLAWNATQRIVLENARFHM